MAIIKKKFGNRIYLYEVVCKRINGKPRIVSQKYLGKPEDVFGPQREEKKIKSARVYDFGGVFALFDIAQKLNIVKVIDSVVQKRSQGISVGEYILLAAINRAVAPRSKQQFWEWYKDTALWRRLGIKRKHLTSQRFWDNMSLLSSKKINSIENHLNKILIKYFKINLSCLLYDTTNFYTFINTLTKCRLPQRGKNKQKRADLRQVNLALIVTRDFNIPLFHKVYEGNKVDVSEFSSVIKKMIERYKILSKSCKDITLVFDKGNNSMENQSFFDKTPYHFIGSLVTSQHKDLLKVPRKKFKKFGNKEFPGFLFYRTKKEVFGKERTIIITFNPRLYEAQVRGILQVLRKKKEVLEGLRKRRRLSSGALEGKIKEVVSGQYIRDIIKWRVRKGKGFADFQWWIDERVFNRIKRECLGKKILFTDREDWSSCDIIRAYHGQWKIEGVFKQMKDPYFVSWRPMFHWTDQKIMVHGFYCVIALLLSSLLMKIVRESGIKISCRRLFQILNRIKEVEVIYPEGKAGVKSEYVLTDLSEEEGKFYALLGLDKYIKNNT